MNKVVLKVLAGSGIFVTGILIGTQFRSNEAVEVKEVKSNVLSVQENLYLARTNLFANLTDVDTFRATAELNALSNFINKILEQEIYWLQLKIWNRPNYDKFENEYREVSNNWKKFYDDEMAKPTGYESGSANSGAVMAREYELLENYKEQLANLLEQMKKEQ